MNTTQLAGQTADAQHEVVIIGAGFSGLAMLETLRARNIEAILLEASDELGGTWSSNRYPGVRTDCESRYYCLSLSQKVIDTWDWKERFPSGGEVREYLNFVHNAHPSLVRNV
ncbi:NAD(P)-binding protein [uncultured Brevibacterium sp.]|uniref:NAD(P)-binding protein n=1 Tax=uncultured Brevibacterium sp. TaxID=189678 RepID=UPI0025DC7F06|nr:NAD(P)-binding protein [uncultured Brevibacterium sp.]